MYMVFFLLKYEGRAMTVTNGNRIDPIDLNA